MLTTLHKKILQWGLVFFVIILMGFQPFFENKASAVGNRSKETRTYKWADYKKPLITNDVRVQPGDPLIVEVNLPENILKYNKKIPLYIISGDAGDGANPQLKINSKSMAVYLFGGMAETKEYRVRIKTKHLKPGLNRLKFYDVNAAYGSFYWLEELRFDLPGLKTDYIAKTTPKPKTKTSPIVKRTPKTKPKKQKTPEKTVIANKIERDKKPPTIRIKSHDTSRAIKLTKIQKKLNLRGQAIDSSGIVEITVDHKDVDFDKDGNFTTDIYLKLGENRIVVSAMDRHENRATKTFTIVRAATTLKQMVTPKSVASVQYHALIIGNNDYRYIKKLDTATGDARAVANILKTEYGFKTKLLLNANRDDIVSEINQFRKILKPADHFLIYYAGHGHYDNSANKAYWLPVDARGDDDTNWIIADRITSNIRRISSKHVLIVSDSCYSGTLTRSTLADLSMGQQRNRYLETIQAKKSRTLLASGGNEPVADGGGGGHSVFASAFIEGLRGMKEEKFSAEELFMAHIKERVAGNADQVPEYNIIRNSGHDGGDFVFQRFITR